MVCLSDSLSVGRIFLRGVGQVFLQRSAWAGICFLGAVAWQSGPLALACGLGTWVGTQWGQRYGTREECEDGLHGYNGALAGIGVLVVLPPGPLAWGLVVVLAWLVTWLAQVWRRHGPLSPYTAPFILATWLLMIIASAAGWPAPVAGTSAVMGDGLMAWAQGTLRGVGQVMFLDDLGAGALCILGLALSRPGAALCAVLASALTLLAALAAGFPGDAASLGLYGFNAVLTAEALRQALPGRWGALCLGVLASLGLMRGFQVLELPSLTAPFVLATLLVRQLSRTLSFFKA
ncbi:MAG: urea transporter [Castellaniella sp.]|nr:urea transporter [Castellaniella sp.]